MAVLPTRKWNNNNNNFFVEAAASPALALFIASEVPKANEYHRPRI